MDDAVFQIIFLAVAVIVWVIKAAADERARRQRREQAPPPIEVGPAAEDAEPHAEGSRRRQPTLRAGLQYVALGQAARAPGPDALHRPDSPAAARGEEILRRRRAIGLARLTGGLPLLPGRRLARAGVLWSEVLGPPRALAGPHRSPTAKRMRP